MNRLFLFAIFIGLLACGQSKDQKENYRQVSVAGEQSSSDASSNDEGFGVSSLIYKKEICSDLVNLESYAGRLQAWKYLGNSAMCQFDAKNLYSHLDEERVVHPCGSEKLYDVAANFPEGGFKSIVTACGAPFNRFDARAKNGTIAIEKIGTKSGFDCSYQIRYLGEKVYIHGDRLCQKIARILGEDGSVAINGLALKGQVYPNYP